MSIHTYTQATVTFRGMFAQKSELGQAPAVTWGSLAQLWALVGTDILTNGENDKANRKKKKKTLTKITSFDLGSKVIA